MQKGIINAVNKIITKAKPSIPNIQFMFKKQSQSLVLICWKYTTVGSKKKSKMQQKLKTKSEQKSPKLRINLYFVCCTKHKTKHENSGNSINKNNIIFLLILN
jgi:hypothetical protein